MKQSTTKWAIPMVSISGIIQRQQNWFKLITKITSGGNKMGILWKENNTLWCRSFPTIYYHRSQNILLVANFPFCEIKLMRCFFFLSQPNILKEHAQEPTTKRVHVLLASSQPDILRGGERGDTSAHISTENNFVIQCSWK